MALDADAAYVALYGALPGGGGSPHQGSIVRIDTSTRASSPVADGLELPTYVLLDAHHVFFVDVGRRALEKIVR